MACNEPNIGFADEFGIITWAIGKFIMMMAKEKEGMLV